MTADANEKADIADKMRADEVNPFWNHPPEITIVLGIIVFRFQSDKDK